MQSLMELDHRNVMKKQKRKEMKALLSFFKKKGLWKAAIESELSSFSENDMWKLKPLPPNRKKLKCRYFLSIKPETENQKKFYNGRLVAKGYIQVYDTDYLNRFAPVLRLALFRILIALAVQESYYIHQMDVATAFLNGDLKEDSHMEQTEGGEDLEDPEYVCHLKNALYRVKQAPSTWYKKIHSVFQSMGVHWGKPDNGIYAGKVRNEVVRIELYLDDLIISCPDSRVLTDVKKSLASQF